LTSHKDLGILFDDHLTSFQLTSIKIQILNELCQFQLALDPSANLDIDQLTKSIRDELIYHATNYDLVIWKLYLIEEEKGMSDLMPLEMLLITGWMHVFLDWHSSVS